MPILLTEHIKHKNDELLTARNKEGRKKRKRINELGFFFSEEKEVKNKNC